MSNGPMPSPFGTMWDYANGPPPWHSKARSSVASREWLLEQKGELLSARVTILQVLRFAADFSREHGSSSTNLANFLSDGIFLSDDVPLDLDDLERCLHKLAYALAMHDSLTIAHLNRLCAEASSSSSQGTSSVRRFGTLLCNLHIATYCALVYREAAGTDATFRDWNILDDNERLFLDLGNVGVAVDPASCMNLDHWGAKIVAALSTSICVSGLVFGPLETDAPLFPIVSTATSTATSTTAVDSIFVDDIFCNAAASRAEGSVPAAPLASRSSIASPSRVTANRPSSEASDHPRPSSVASDRPSSRPGRLKPSYTKSSLLGKDFDFDESADAPSYAQQVSTALRQVSSRVLDFFREIDTSGDGLVSKVEFCNQMRSLGLDLPM